MKPRILVVEDDADIRELMSLVLEGQGYEVVGAEDGFAALQVLSEAPPVALAFVDLAMPRMDGVELVRAIHADPRLAELPVVVVSGNRAAQETAAKLGVAGQLGKPLDLGDLIGMTQSLLTSPRVDRHP